MDYQKEGHRTEMEALLYELSFKDIKMNMLSFFDCCLMSQREALEIIPNDNYARRLTMDSMDISHAPTDLKYLVTRKTPLR